MKNTKLIIAAIIGTVACSSLIASSVLAAPPGPPPAPNTPDASFNSVNLTTSLSIPNTSAVTPVLVNNPTGGGGINVTVNGAGGGAIVTDNNGSGNGMSVYSGTGTTIYANSSDGMSIMGFSPKDDAILGRTSSSMGGDSGVVGEINGTIWGYGVSGIAYTDGSIGVRGLATGLNSTGVSASGTNVGVSASTGASGSYGVISTSPNGVGVYGNSTTNYGVMGISNSALGVYGNSNSSNGVQGYSTSSYGVQGSTSTGVGVKGFGGSAGGEFSRTSFGTTNQVRLSTASNSIETTGNLDINDSGGYNVAVTTNGRLRVGTGGSLGGLWLGDADHFIGQYDATSFGFWNNAAWRMIMDNAGRLSNPTGWFRIADAVWIDSNQLWVDGVSTLVGAVTAQNGLTISGPTGYNIGLNVAGRIASGNNSGGGTGGMWVGGNGGGQFFGSQNGTYAGIYNNGYWGLTTNYWGNSQTSGVLTTGAGIISQAGLLATTNIYALNGWVDAERFTGRCQWSGDLGMGNDGYGVSGCSGDVAEVYDTSEKTEPGDILMLDPNGKMLMQLADKDSLTQLTGVVSTSAGLILKDSGPVVSNGQNDGYITDKQTLLALTGKAPVKVNLENGPIKVGDYITASSTPGVGMKANVGDQTIGIAMENFDSEEEGQIFVLTDNAGSVSQLKAELDKKIASLEERLAKLEAKLNN